MSAIDLSHVQRHILFGLGRGPTGAGLYELTDPPAFRAWLEAAPIPSCTESSKRSRLGRQLQCSVGFTARGLDGLNWTYPKELSGVSPGEEYFHSDGQAFHLGAAMHAQGTDWLDDFTHAHHPHRWRYGWEPRRADVVITCAASSAQAVEDFLGAIPGLAVLGIEAGEAATSGPFGFADGLSQPVPDVMIGCTTATTSPAPDNIRPAGDFLVGRPSSVPQPLTAPDWARDGSFMVLRTYKADPQVFERWIGDTAAALDSTVGAVESMIMGRSRSGQVTFGNLPGTFPALRPSDPYRLGSQPLAARRLCPATAHARRANPRDGAELRIRPRILRRSILRQSAGELCFVCFQSCIDTQFGQIMASWLQRSRLPGDVPGERDALLGHLKTPREIDLHWPRDGRGERRSVTTSASFLAPVGGAFAFLPSLPTLARIAAGPQPTQELAVGQGAPRRPLFGQVARRF